MAATACPDEMSEGPSAAPGSPYPDPVCISDGGSLPWILSVTAALVVVFLVVAIARGRRPGLWSLVLLVGPAVLVAALQLTIPKDCSSGRTETGDCSRDREQF